ncbi:hypothetical protein ACIA5D_29870 [Actinoplanes sp. NPDC051513]|uniref:hypothetical protein n=1 Tax=Actinoplanes sp. NPDC051513 TaxID=3363908 RepID=UPI00379213F3
MSQVIGRSQHHLLTLKDLMAEVDSPTGARRRVRSMLRTPMGCPPRGVGSAARLHSSLERAGAVARAMSAADRAAGAPHVILEDAAIGKAAAIGLFARHNDRYQKLWNTADRKDDTISLSGGGSK